ncbi:metal-sensitive transcriptional regulator [Streptomyces sp. XD-27]|uniref:metal-sensitive transcriptional regulator n=1 Tax=Streptomyces sp. XD-27 TaxID=3062779 RepID=UPI0026F44759|nr:metal-sensitive transcriptional regulator [Streptomyces sp. XD-27]WKX69389.1 metal-sensitive transcriptional regulator [Streptomyces sp. XD-27]
MAGYEDHKDKIRRRLRRIEGQVRGLQRMVEEDTYCIDVLTQISATTAALQSCSLTLLEEHLNCCVSEALTQGGDEARSKVSEATQAIARLVRA